MLWTAGISSLSCCCLFCSASWMVCCCCPFCCHSSDLVLRYSAHSVLDWFNVLAAPCTPQDCNSSPDAFPGCTLYQVTKPGFVCYVFTHAMLAIIVSVCPSVASRCSTEMVRKNRITQTMPHDSLGTVVFWCRKSWQNSNRVTPNEGDKCRWGGLNAGAVAAANWRLLMQSILNLA